MPLSFTGINPAQATALTSLANRQQQTLVPQFAYQRALMDASKQQALAALSLNKQQILNQRNISTGIEQTNLSLQDIQRRALESLNQYRTGMSTALSQQGAVSDAARQLREMRLKSFYGNYAMDQAAEQQDIAGINQSIANISSAASSLYQSRQQQNYARQLINYINGIGTQQQQYPTWQYTRTS